MWIYLFLLIIAIFTHWNWVNSIATLTSGDWSYQSIVTLREFLGLPQMWTNTAMGAVNIGASFYPFQFVYGLLAHANMSYGLIERLVFLWPIVILSNISGYLLLRKNIKNTFAAIVGAFVYAYNTYFLSIQAGHLTMMIAFAIAPLALLFFQKTLESKKIFDSIITGIVLFIISFYEFRGFYVVAFVLFSYFFYYQFILEKGNVKKTLIKNGLVSVVPFVLVGLLNLYWLLGFLNMGTLTTNVIFDRSLFGSEFLNINYALTLFHPFWTGGKTTEFIQLPIPPLFWLIPVAAITGLVLQRKNPAIIYFGLIALLGLLLTKQAGQPFTGLYLWLYEHFPGFNAFREASKFYFLIALGYSALIAAFIDWVWQNWNTTKWKVYGKYAVTIFIALLFLWNAKPLVTGELRTLFVARQMPHDYEIINAFLSKQNSFSRTLWVPTTSRWADYTSTHPQVSAIDQVNNSWSDLIEPEMKLEKYSEAELIIKSLQKSSSDNLLDTSSIQYVIVPIQDAANEDNFFRYYGKNREYYLNALNKISYLQKIDIGTKEIVVYENKNFLPHISSSKKVKVQYTYVNASEYKVSLKGIAEPFTLQFAESYHPQWKLHLGQFNWFSALINKQYFISDNLHNQDKSYLNAYTIDPQVLCAEANCVRRADGRYDMDLTLFFKPQAYTYLGGLISLSALVGVAVFLFYVCFTRLKNEKNKNK